MRVYLPVWATEFGDSPEFAYLEWTPQLKAKIERFQQLCKDEGVAWLSIHDYGVFEAGWDGDGFMSYVMGGEQRHKIRSTSLWISDCRFYLGGYCEWADHEFETPTMKVEEIEQMVIEAAEVGYVVCKENGEPDDEKIAAAEKAILDARGVGHSKIVRPA